MAQYRVIPLGTCGGMPTPVRQTACVAVEAAGQLIVFDAGTGLSRLAQPQMGPVLEKYAKIHLFLSHFHLDHVIGLFYLPYFCEGRKLSIYGPGKEVGGFDTEEALLGFTSAPFSPARLDRSPYVEGVGSLRAGRNSFASFEISAALQDHPGGSLAMRLDDAVAYLTDTGGGDESRGLAGGARLLLHEVWSDSLAEAPEGHTNIRTATEVAAEAGAGRLALIHLNPEYSEERLAKMAVVARSFFPMTCLAEDLTAIEVD